jgi:hypothetical protein
MTSISAVRKSSPNSFDDIRAILRTRTRRWALRLVYKMATCKTKKSKHCTVSAISLVKILEEGKKLDLKVDDNFILQFIIMFNLRQNDFVTVQGRQMNFRRGRHHHVSKVINRTDASTGPHTHNRIKGNRSFQVTPQIPQEAGSISFSLSFIGKESFKLGDNIKLSN